MACADVAAARAKAANAINLIIVFSNLFEGSVSAQTAIASVVSR